MQSGILQSTYQCLNNDNGACTIPHSGIANNYFFIFSVGKLATSKEQRFTLAVTAVDRPIAWNNHRLLEHLQIRQVEMILPEER